MSYLFDRARLLTDPKLKFENDNGKPRAICELFLVFANPKKVSADVSPSGWKNREFKVNASVFDKLGEKAVEMFKSGDPVLVSGNLVWPTIVDRNTGEEKPTKYLQLYVDTISPDLMHIEALQFNERKSKANASASPVSKQLEVSDQGETLPIDSLGVAAEPLSEFETEFLDQSNDLLETTLNSHPQEAREVHENAYASAENRQLVERSQGEKLPVDSTTVAAEQSTASESEFLDQSNELLEPALDSLPQEAHEVHVTELENVNA